MIIQGDCLNVMKKFPDNHFSAIVTDPPYGLHFMGQDWDHGIPGVQFWVEALRICKPGSFILSFGGTRTYHRLTCAIEDAGWEIRDCIFWCFGSGFPKSHNFGCKCTGDPLPYNHVQRSSESKVNLPNLSEGISESALLGKKDEKCSLQLPMSGCNSSKSAGMDGSYEKNSLQQPGEKVPISRHEDGEESSLERRSNLQEEQGKLHRPDVCEMPNGILRNGQEGWICNGTSLGNGKEFGADSSEGGSCTSQGSQHSEQSNRESGTIPEQSNSQDCGMGACQKCGGLIAFKGYGTALKPAYEPIIMAMKPLDGTFKQNAEKWGQAGINIDECRIKVNSGDYQHPGNKNKTLMAKNCYQASLFGNLKVTQSPPNSIGRWPANLILDEEAARMLDEQTGVLKSGHLKQILNQKQNKIYGKYQRANLNEFKASSGGASRFFYCSKASSRERNEGLDCDLKVGGIKNGDPYKEIKRRNNHPTIKPIKLMEYLIKLVMPPTGGALLDPFAGSGTTILAAKRLGFDAIGIERSEEYVEIAKSRCETSQMELLA